MKAIDKKKLESVWFSLLRKLVRNGYKRKNAPSSRAGNIVNEVDADYFFIYSNEDLRTLLRQVAYPTMCNA